MNAAAWDRAGPGEVRPEALWRLAQALAAVAMLAIYSQAWVFPLIGENPAATDGGLIRGLFFPAYAVGAALFVRAPGETLRAAVRQPFLLLLMFIVGLSVVWSVAPDQTARRAFAVYCTTLGGVVLAARWRWAQMAEIMAACFAGLAALSLVTSLLVPSVGVMHELFPGAWRGLWEEKNAFGGNMALGFVVLAAAAALNPRRTRLWAPFAALALGLVLMSTSKTSLVALLLGLGGLGFVALARRGPAAGVATSWVAVLGVATIGGLLLFAADLFFAVLGKDATFTGRTRIWSAAMRQIAERPWTGFGYGAVWGETGPWGPLAHIVKDAGFKPQHAHNAWIEQWLSLGVFGLAAFALTFLQTLALAVVAVFRDRGAYLAIPFLVVYSLMSMTESIAVVYNDLRWVLFVAIAVKLVWPDWETDAGAG